MINLCKTCRYKQNGVCCYYDIALEQVMLNDCNFYVKGD